MRRVKCALAIAPKLRATQIIDDNEHDVGLRVRIGSRIPHLRIRLCSKANVRCRKGCERENSLLQNAPAGELIELGSIAFAGSRMAEKVA
jgi:hypothetical protein